MNQPSDPSVTSNANPSTSPFPTGESKVGVVHAPQAPTVPTAPAPEPSPAPVAEAAQPEPVVAMRVPPAPEPVVALAAPVRAALQESLQVPIPLRMNQLQSKHTALRDELDALEESLKSPPK